MSHEHDDKAPIEIPIEELKAMATSIAAEIRAAADRAMPIELRNRFINVRAALFQRGIYDAILVRFDSATVPPASLPEIAAELDSVAAGL